MMEAHGVLDFLILIIGGRKTRQAYRDHTAAIAERTAAARELAAARRR